jgi:signal transduction histidine kinase
VLADIADCQGHRLLRVGGEAEVDYRTLRHYEKVGIGLLRRDTQRLVTCQAAWPGPPPRVTFGGCCTAVRAYNGPVRSFRYNSVDLLRYAGLFTYACVGLPLVVESLGPTPVADPDEQLGWGLSYLAFGIFYVGAIRDLGTRLTSWRNGWLVLAMSASAIAIGYFSRSGLTGVLLMIMSGVLPWLQSWRRSLAWVVAVSVLMVPVYAMRLDDYTLATGLAQGALYLSFALFVLLTGMVAKSEAEAREEQKRLNAELRATRVLLAESTRMSERVRISRELHDLIGHHLTALSLNLEVASHLVQGKAVEHVRQAQSLARLLLSDVREVVSQLREGDDIDLGKALRALTEGIPEPAIHLDIPADLSIDDPRRATVLLRCAQETITNTIRHARARNLWLSFARDPEGGWRMSARDDGLGSEQLEAGNGLSGMRERLAQIGGRLSIETGKGRGFALEAHIPEEAKA